MGRSDAASATRVLARPTARTYLSDLQPERLGPLGLTTRECEVLTWVTAGKSNREIGVILQCAAKTVEKHLEHIYEKLDVPNRAAAAATAAVALTVAP